MGDVVSIPQIFIDNGHQIKELLDAILRIIRSLPNVIGFIVNVIDAVDDNLSTLLDAIVGFIELGFNLISFLVSNLDTIFELITSGITLVFDAVVALLENEDGIITLFTSIGSLITTLITQFSALLEALPDLITTTFTVGIKALKLSNAVLIFVPALLIFYMALYIMSYIQ